MVSYSQSSSCFLSWPISVGSFLACRFLPRCALPLGLILLVALPAEVRNVILIAAAGIAVVAAFGYWTHVDKRFLIPDDKPGKDQV